MSSGRRSPSLAFIVVFTLTLGMGAAARAACPGTNNQTPGPDNVQQWRRWDREIVSGIDYLAGNPSRDLLLTVTFTQCDVGMPISYTTRAFWYGLKLLPNGEIDSRDGKAFRLRGAFPPGKWQWELKCSRRPGHHPDTKDCSQDQALNGPDLQGARGEFTIQPSSAGNALYKNGLLKVSPSAMAPALVYDATPSVNFFWLGDTVWNANVLMDRGAWNTFIGNRAANASKQFTVLQMGFNPDINVAPPQQPFEDTGGAGCPRQDQTQGPGQCFRMNPLFWHEFDYKVQKANQSNIVMVLAGIIHPKTAAPGSTPIAAPEAQLFAEAVTARMLGNFVIFSPGFDHRVSVAGIRDKIDKVGTRIREVDLRKQQGQPNRSIHLITNHTAGGSDVTDYNHLHSKPWLDFELFQSGTPRSPEPNDTLADELKKLTERAVTFATTLSNLQTTTNPTKKKPAINGESVYPGIVETYTNLAVPVTHPDRRFDSAENHTPYRARQAGYYSMLSGAQGYTVGTCGVFNWGLGDDYDKCLDWDENDPGVTRTIGSMRELRSIFQSVRSWPKLKPAARVLDQPPSTPPDRKIVLAYDGSDAILAYLPNEAPSIKVSVTGLKDWPDKWSAEWRNPRTSQTPIPIPATALAGTSSITLTKPAGPTPASSACERYDLTTPLVDCQDWVLRITKGKSQSIQVANGALSAQGALQVTAQITDAAGTVVGEKVLGDSAGSPGAPQIATAAGGTSMVVWQDDDGTDITIYGRVVDSQGVPVSGLLTIASGPEASPGHPAVGALANGQFIVAWAGADETNYGPWIRTRRYTSQGGEVPAGAGAVAVACSYVPGDFPQVAGTGVSDGYVLAWELADGAGIYVLKVENSGSTRSDARIAENTGAIAVLETIHVFSSSTITVSYGLYAADGSPAGSGSPAVALQPQCNVPVLAANDAFSTDAGRAITIAYRELLQNDAPDATFEGAGPKCVPTPDGQGCTYTPLPGFTGSDTFTYTVRDALNNPGSALVTITVQPPLVANPDSFTMEGDTSLQITSTQLLSNDSAGAVFVDALNPAHGFVTCAGTNPAICTFTPTAGFRGAASFEYRISRDGNLPAVTGTATITVQQPSAFNIIQRCSSGVCVLTAVAPNAQAARAYVWRINNAPSETSVYKINHRFGGNGTYPVEVTVLYNGGLPQLHGSTTVKIEDYAAAPTWTTTVEGLGFNLDEFDLTMFPGTTRIPTINWSADPADCADPSNGCGEDFAAPDTSCFLQNCRLYGSYSHTGIFDATLRIQDGGVVLREYPVAMEAVNQNPAPSFTVSRPDPNVRSYFFTNINHGDDGPYPVTYAWDFGDGSEDSGGENKTHFYPSLGTYNATLTVTDGDGQTGAYTLPIDVTNAPPVPRLTVNCRGLDCELGAESSTDDGSNISIWSWSFGDGQTGSGSRVIHHYAAGCYTVTLTITDGDGASAMTTAQVVAGPPLVSENTGVVVDAHVQSYHATVNGVTGWHTTNGNLNGILEPGETVVVEPTWPFAPSAQQLPVSAFGQSPWGNEYGFRHTAPWYDISAGVSDCWSLGDCYTVFALPQYAANRPVHADIRFTETNLATGGQTPGSPIEIHVGKSFSDVPATHWSYAGIESVLHAGVDTGCGGTQFCPGTAVTRGEIARWLLKARHDGSYQPPACAAAPFNDVPCSHPFAAWIAQLKSEGLISGTGNGNYTPDQPVSRAEAAVLVLRALMGAEYVPPACSPDFGDVACGGHWAAAWISDVKARGISRGCDLTEFCPGDAVDRAQAAALFAKAFELRIDTLQCPVITNNGFDLVPTHVDLPPIVGITFNPNPAVVGGVSTATMTIGDPPPVATSIPLSIDNPAASVPASVNVPALATSATFAVTPANITVRTTTQITATYLGHVKTVALDICTQPASISVQPASRIINHGQSTTLSVTANGGGGPLSYQWYTGTAPSTATPVPGATGSTLTVTPNATTSYWVRVSATCGGVNSVTATVTVCHLPQIPGPPLNDYVVVGSPTTLTATVTGSGPLTYQWYEGTTGNTASPVGTDPTFTTPAITVPRSYWLRVTSTCNGPVSVDSPTATITPVTQITRRQLAANSVNSLTSITTNWTRPTQPGSLLVAVMTSNHVSTVGAFGVPAGWLQAAGYEWNNLKTTIYYYPNNPGGRTSETITTASFRESVLQLIEYVGATATPLDVTAFDGDNTPRPGGEVSTGTTQWMTQPKAVLVSALSTAAGTSFTGATNGFSKLDERSVYQNVTAAVHERMVNAIGNYGHSATVEGASQWLGVIATFKSINDCTAAPTITAHPQPATINAGQATTLTVTATGGGLAYQWYSGASGTTTNPVIGANAPSLPVTPSATASYWVRVSNACGAASSTAATVTVCQPLSIATQPLSQSVTSGFAATLSVTPSGSGPFSYQWYEGASGTTTTPVSGATNATFTTPPLTANKSYWVRVSSTCNGTTNVSSSTAVLSVSSASQIARRQLAAGSENSQTSITTNWTQPTQAGSLLVAVISAQHGAAVGNLTPPAGWQLATSYEMANLKSAIYYYPNHPGGRTAETFGAAGFRELVLQLMEYTGATASPLDKVAFNGDMAVSGGIVSTGTTAATAQAKEVIVTALTMMAQASFTNPTNGFARLDQRNVYNSITAAVHERIATAAGAYGHSTEVDANNQWVGLVATFKSLDLCSAPPTITAQPAPKSISSGQTATLSVTATTSGGTLSYQWYEGASGVTTTPVGTNNASFTTPPLTASKSYWVRVSNECGNVASNAAAVTVCVSPAIGAQPASSTINSGQTATLSVTATGGGPFTYQWYEGASGVTTTPVGTNSASFTTPALTATKSYWVRVTGACNSANSNAATITVCTLPSIATHPASQTISSGSSATLSVVAGGSSPLSYQWYEGASGTTTTPVGTNSATFTTPALTAAKSYWVRVTSTCNGTATANSNAATITVNAPTLARRQLAASTANSQLTITANWTQPTQAGNLLVAIVSAQRSFYPIANWQPPAGWQLAVSYEMTHIKTSIYYYPNNPGGRTAETFGNGGYYDDMILQLAEYTGIVTVSPLDKTNFNGNASNDGYIETGYTQQTSQARELVITALTAHATTEFHGASQGFVELDDRNQGFGNLTTAVHEKIVTTANQWGHYAQVLDPAEWVGVVATFKGQ